MKKTTRLPGMYRIQIFISTILAAVRNPRVCVYTHAYTMHHCSGISVRYVYFILLRSYFIIIIIIIIIVLLLLLFFFFYLLFYVSSPPSQRRVSR
jgi:hypothetical protein